MITADDIAELAAAAFARLPPTFRALCGDLLIRVDESAEADVLDDLEIDDPLDLLGLYQGTDFGHKGLDDTGALPDMVFLYRAAIEDFLTTTDDSIEAVVTHILVHEIGHHFGLSDEDMESIEEAAAQGPDA